LLTIQTDTVNRPECFAPVFCPIQERTLRKLAPRDSRKVERGFRVPRYSLVFGFHCNQTGLMRTAPDGDALWQRGVNAIAEAQELLAARRANLAWTTRLAVQRKMSADASIALARRATDTPLNVGLLEGSSRDQRYGAGNVRRAADDYGERKGATAEVRRLCMNAGVIR
jgi:hypothetical protein